jgi:alpha-tubulin suppressor-like RCC1 family protein
MVSCGDWHTLALETNGHVWAWGANMELHNRGQCGAGPIPVLERPHLISFFVDKEVTMLAAGGTHSLAVCGDNTMYGWGCGEKGQTGLGDFYDTANPRKCAPFGSDLMWTNQSEQNNKII